MDFEKGDFMDLFLVYQKMYFVFNVQINLAHFWKNENSKTHYTKD